MSPDYVVELMKGLMAHIMMLATPLLLTGMTVGLLAVSYTHLRAHET